MGTPNVMKNEAHACGAWLEGRTQPENKSLRSQIATANKKIT